MSKTLGEEVECLKKYMLQGQAVMVFGLHFDFIAFNYGDGEFAGGRDSLVTSAFGHARIDRTTGTWSFKPRPDVPIREASHFEFDHVEVNLTFLQVKEEIEKQTGART